MGIHIWEGQAPRFWSWDGVEDYPQPFSSHFLSAQIHSPFSKSMWCTYNTIWPGIKSSLVGPVGDPGLTTHIFRRNKRFQSVVFSADPRVLPHHHQWQAVHRPQLERAARNPPGALETLRNPQKQLVWKNKPSNSIFGMLRGERSRWDQTDVSVGYSNGYWIGFHPR